MAPSLLRPKSRGSVTLGGPSIHDAPVIDTNYLDHPDDIRTLVEGMKFLKGMERTELFKKYEMLLIGEDVLCGDRHELFSGTNCIKIGLTGKLILSKRKGLREVIFS